MLKDSSAKTLENLKEAFAGESQANRKYLAFAAKTDIEDEAEMSFTNANAVEKIHAGLYQKYLDSMSNLAAVDIYVCQVCGNTVEGNTPDMCPICASPKDKFKKIV